MKTKLFLSKHAALRLKERFNLVLCQGSVQNLNVTRIEGTKHFKALLTIGTVSAMLILEERPNRAFAVITALLPNMTVRALAA
jgi:hypothetical protein